MGNNVTLIPKKPDRHSLLTSTENVVYMPLASKESHGIVRIGDGLVITTDGLVSVDFTSGWYDDIETDVEVLKSDVVKLDNNVDLIKTDVNTLTTKIFNLETGEKLIPIYQTKNDLLLNTVDKTVVGGINELKTQTQVNISDINDVKVNVSDIKTNYATVSYVNKLYSTVSMGGHKSIVFNTRDDFISWLDGAFVREDALKPVNLMVGDMVLIVEMGVPDYWVKSKNSPMTINDFAEYEAKIEVPEVKIDSVSISKNDSGELQAISLKNGLLKLSDVVERDDFKGWTELNELQFKELVEYGSTVVAGETIVFDENAVYVTPDSSYGMTFGNKEPDDTVLAELGQFYFDVVNKKLYQFVDAATHEWQAVGAGVSQEDFDKLVNNEVQIVKTTQYGKSFRAGNGDAFGNNSISIGNKAISGGNGDITIGNEATTPVGGSSIYSVVIGNRATTKQGRSIVIGSGATITSANYPNDTEDGIAIGRAATINNVNNAIQLGTGTNSIEKTLQIYNDNIYNHDTHTLTVQNMNRYLHNFVYNFNDAYVLVSVLNKTETAMTRADLYALLVESGHTSLTTMLSAGGVHANVGVIGIYANTENSCLTVFTTTRASYDLDMTDDYSSLTFNDTVVQL